jgi:hypothetical protein
MKATNFLKATRSLNGFLKAILTVMFLFQFGYPALAKPADSRLIVAEVPLKNLEGIYRFPNQVAYVRIYQKEGKLVAKQIWDNVEYELKRESELEFGTVNQIYKASFIREKDSITGIRLNDRILLTKVNYDPSKQISLGSEKLNKLQGRYQFQKDKKLFIEIKASNNGLILHQLWDDKKFSFVPRSEVDFFNQEHSFPLHFNIVAMKVKQIVCFGKDPWEKVN